MSFKSSKEKVEPYKTRDGSMISELMHPAVHGNKNQSLAEARVFPGQTTLLHSHKMTEELYHIMEGEGLMTRGGDVFRVSPGDTIFIEAGKSHCIKNTGSNDLVFLCCCSPAYSHEDTYIDEGC